MEPTLQRNSGERSLGELVSDATRESADLFRKEIELAKLEVVQAIGKLKSGVAGMAIAVPLLFAGLLTLVLAAVLAVDTALQRPWLSAVVVGGTVTLVGLLALVTGRQLVKHADLTPHQSVDSLRDDKAMLQRHLSTSR